MDRMTVIVYRAGGTWHVSLAPEVDVGYWRGKGTVPEEGWQYRSVAHAVRDWRRLRRRGLHAWAGKGAVSGARVSIGRMDDSAWAEGRALWERLRPLVTGRSLLLREVPRLLASRGAELPSSRMLKQGLQAGILVGEVRLESGIRLEGGEGRWRCARCQAGREKLVRTMCAACGGKCVYCDHCLLLGRSTACEPLLQFPLTGGAEGTSVSLESEAARGEARPSAAPAGRKGLAPAAGRPSGHRGRGSGTAAGRRMSAPVPHRVTLTPAQQRAAAAALTFVQKGTDPFMLLWAVTGAGKTEMTFDVINHVIRAGGRVAVATPRKDVVDELAPRLRQAFPFIRVVKLHGDSGETWADGPLIVATTHQLWRWYRAFDLIIVDEVDAYPYAHDAALAAGLRRALREKGQELWLTATPTRRWQAAFRNGRLPGVTIPARYHGHPLPEPHIEVERRLWPRLRRKRPLPSMTAFFADVVADGGQVYVFVPGVVHIPAVVAWLKRYVPELSVTGVSSRDRRRSEKIRAFRENVYDGLVTTTILERGVTVAHAHVLILQADHPIFDEAALVQMSGRSGRSAQFPGGRVCWIATARTRELTRARRHIRAMNREAARHGWLTGEGHE